MFNSHPPFLSLNARWVRWEWLPTIPTILIDGSVDDLVPTPVPAPIYTVTTAMSHLPSSSVRDHMKWVCFENTKLITVNFVLCHSGCCRCWQACHKLSKLTIVLHAAEITACFTSIVKSSVVFNGFSFCFFGRRGCLAARLSSPAWP